MALSIATWSCMLSACLLISASNVGGLDIGGDIIPRALVDSQQNKSIIGNPHQAMGIDGLVTGLKSYMVNINDCIRLQVWRPPASMPTPATPYGTTPSSHTTPTRTGTPSYPTQASATYWLLVQQALKCVRGETANRTFMYHLPEDEHIRFEATDVLGFSFYPNNPVPYDKNNASCLRWQLAQSALQQPAVQMSGNVYSFLPLPDCRVYSLKAAIKKQECVTLTPIIIAQNLTFTSSGRNHEDHCWRIKPIWSLSPGVSTIIYLKYLVMTMPGCDIGHLEIREGRSSTSPLIQRDCRMPLGLQAELRPITTGNVYIRLWRRRNRGGAVTITLQYSTERIMVPSCRPVPITEKPIFIGSPNYPRHYPPNSNICWKLSVPASSMYRVRVELSTGIDLQAPLGCTGTTGYSACKARHCKDFIEVKDKDGALLTKWCDHTGQDLIETSSEGTMTIKFVSDAAVQGTGFQIKAFAVYPETAQCTHYLALFEKAPLQSPYYPYSYPPNRDDCWSVRANDENKRLLVTILDSNLEAGVLCDNDFIEVRDGASSTAPLLRRWCGTSKPTPLLTSGAYLYIRFVSDGNLNYRGFAISYTQVRSDACTTYYAYSHREYLKPDYDQLAIGYDIRCWVLRTETGKLRLQWDSLGRMTRTTICGSTYVELRDGDSMSAPLLGKFCGHSPIPPNGVASTGGAIYVRWVSDINARPANFRLVYMSLSSSHCPLMTVGDSFPVQYLQNHLPGMSTTAYPPFYRTSAKPRTNRPVAVVPCSTCKYGPSQQRCWTIEADPGYTSLVITVRFMELQGKDDRGQCKYDFVEMRDGNSGDDPLLASLCGTVRPRNFTTTGRWLLVHFQSDALIELRGFQMEVRAYKGKDECTSLDARNYIRRIKSPTETLYPVNTRKCWTIWSPGNGKPVKIFASHMTLDEDDVIEFYDGPSSDDILLRRFDMSTRQGATVMSSGSTMMIILRTGKRSTSRGQFELQYSWVYEGLCSYVPVEDEPIYITTKNYGLHNYSKNDYLCWVMTVLEPAHTIEITAESFMLEDSLRCSSDYLEIYDGPQKNGDRFLHRWCSEMADRVLARSSSRSLFVVFSSNDRFQFPGFKLKVASRTGQVITRKQGSGGGSEGDSNNNQSLTIVLSVIGAVLIVILIVAVFLWNRKRNSASAAAEAARVEAPAPVVVYTHQPPAYRPPSILGAVGHDLPVEERKVPLPANEEVDPQRTPTPTTPASPGHTADTSTLL